MAAMEEQITRMWRRLARENALLLTLLADGHSLREAEQALRASEWWVAYGLRPPRRAERGRGPFS
jgi:hypothetical protein